MARKSAKQHIREVIDTSSTPARRWPDEFASPRDGFLTLCCLIFWSGALFVLAAGNNLLGLKQALLLVAGARLEPVLSGNSLQSMDIAVVLIGAVLVIAGSHIHVSVGLAVVLALRPWLDGFTYPVDNTYFLWACFYLTGVWGVRQWRAPKPFRGTVPLMLLFGFIAWGGLGLLTSIQVGSTLTDLLLWTGYAAVLLLALNCTETALARRIVLLGLLAGVVGQALFAYPHLTHVLPWLRQALQSDPELLARWFKGATEFTPELARRFNLNRAFASMVFPNALAALLLLGLTPMAGLGIDAWTRLRRERVPRSGEDTRPVGIWLLVSAVLFVATALVVFALGLLVITYQTATSSPIGSMGSLGMLSASVAAVPAVVFLVAAISRGTTVAFLVVQGLGAVVFTPVIAGALWITYSRGAMLALALALGVALLHVLWHNRREIGVLGYLGARRVSMWLLLLMTLPGLAVLALPVSGEAPVGTATNTVSAEGMDVTLAELANPASFAARLGYWRVATRIAFDHALLGVGLGNFGIAYGPVQDLEAGDVRNAHSVVLQTLCETGIPGLLMFLAFWSLFLWRVAQRLPHMLNHGQVAGAGLAVGLIAFLIHALIDINFSHPSLVMMAMASLGLFYQISSPTQERQISPRTRAAALVLVVIAAVASGVAMRPYLQALGLNGGRFINVSNQEWLGMRHQVAVFLLADCAAWGRQGKSGTPPRIPIASVASLIPDEETMHRIGRVLAPDPTRQGWVIVEGGQPLPANGLLEIQRPWDAHALGMDRLGAWAQELEFLDARFPHGPELALTLSQLYKLMVEQASIKEKEHVNTFLKELEYWAETAVRRSPRHKDMHENLAWAYWTVATQRTGHESMDYYLRALEAFAQARTLGHLEPRYYFAEAGALEAIGKSYARQGFSEQSAPYLSQAETIRASGLTLQSERWRRGLQ